MAHPAEAEAWQWDEANESELAVHQIYPVEVVQVHANGPTWVPNRHHRAGDWKMIGGTDGGRALTVVVRYLADQRLLRAVTGWDTTSGEHTRYAKGRRAP